MKIDEIKIKNVRQLQSKILTRFMTPEEYDQLIVKYMESRKGGGGFAVRERKFRIPLTPSEKKALYLYLTLQSIWDVKKILGVTKPDWIGRIQVGDLAMRFLSQNLDSLSLKELLDGGETK